MSALPSFSIILARALDRQQADNKKKKMRQIVLRSARLLVDNDLVANVFLFGYRLVVRWMKLGGAAHTLSYTLQLPVQP
jgi:hypothetical protein